MAYNGQGVGLLGGISGDRAFSGCLTVGNKLPGIVRQQATSLSATTAVRVSVFCFAIFRILSVTFSRSLSQSLAHAQQRSKTPRVCILTIHVHYNFAVLQPISKFQSPVDFSLRVGSIYTQRECTAMTHTLLCVLTT